MFSQDKLHGGEGYKEHKIRAHWYFEQPDFDQGIETWYPDVKVKGRG